MPADSDSGYTPPVGVRRADTPIRLSPLEHARGRDGGRGRRRVGIPSQETEFDDRAGKGPRTGMEANLPDETVSTWEDLGDPAEPPLVAWQIRVGNKDEVARLEIARGLKLSVPP